MLEHILAGTSICVYAMSVYCCILRKRPLDKDNDRSLGALLASSRALGV